MSSMTLEVKEAIHVLTLTNNENENTFTLDVMQEYLSAFDVVEEYEGNTALLIRCEHEKTFSTGINLAWLMDQPKEGKKAFILALETVLYRLALLNAPTVVCINGNAYAGGAILASAADFRVMRSDRGRFCFPEVDINMSFPPLMMDVINLLPNKQALKYMALTGKAYTGVECEALDLVDSIHPMDELQLSGFKLAKSLGQKDRVSYTRIRNAMRPDIARHSGILGLA